MGGEYSCCNEENNKENVIPLSDTNNDPQKYLSSSKNNQQFTYAYKNELYTKIKSTKSFDRNNQELIIKNKEEDIQIKALEADSQSSGISDDI